MSTDLEIRRFQDLLSLYQSVVADHIMPATLIPAIDACVMRLIELERTDEEYDYIIAPLLAEWRRLANSLRN